LTRYHPFSVPASSKRADNTTSWHETLPVEQLSDSQNVHGLEAFSNADEAHSNVDEVHSNLFCKYLIQGVQVLTEWDWMQCIAEDWQLHLDLKVLVLDNVEIALSKIIYGKVPVTGRGKLEYRT
jgi:hypothetical protein